MKRSSFLKKLATIIAAPALLSNIKDKPISDLGPLKDLPIDAGIGNGFEYKYPLPQNPVYMAQKNDVIVEWDIDTDKMLQPIRMWHVADISKDHQVTLKFVTCDDNGSATRIQPVSMVAVHYRKMASTIENF